jgi:AmmeMemoRadiSam system protein B
VVASDPAHAQEHSLEVQLPFLQTVLGRFELVPLAVGKATAAEVAEVLDRLWGGEETLIVISSDLSHFHTYREAQRIDGETAQHILALEPLTNFEQACGALPINGLLAVARRRGLSIERVAQCNSGIPRATNRASSATPPSPCMRSGATDDLGPRCCSARATPLRPNSASRCSPSRTIPR